MPDAADVLSQLDFGRVDSESEPDLESRFVRTDDFARFLDARHVVIQGAKGSGKSALFEMFAKHLESAKVLAGDELDHVLISTGTGFGDLRELSTADIQGFQSRETFSYDNLWRLYIALKAALSLGQQGYSSKGPLRDLLRAANAVTDYRIGPVMSSIWQVVGGNAPPELSAEFMGIGVKLVSGKQSLDVLDLLEDVQDVLARNDKHLWLLFDKIDEIHPSDPPSRKRALEGLFPAAMAVQRTFPRIMPRIFIRTDLYGPELNFTNKSHLVDKTFEIRWGVEQLRVLLVKRGLAAEDVAEYAKARVPALVDTPVENLTAQDLMAAYHVLFDERAYGGKKEAKTLDWMVARATDAKGGTFPRELITYGNIAKQKQLEAGGPGDPGLIDGRSIVHAYPRVSAIRCETFLSEFPSLQAHFKRFRGQRDAPFTRQDLHTLFEGLTPDGNEAIEQLHEVGVLGATGGKDVAIAEAFEVPRLYRAGLGLQILARP